MTEQINQMEPEFSEEEAQAAYDYVKSGGWLTDFKKTREFEKVMAEYTGAKFCTIVNSGTIALQIALMSIGIGKKSKVIVPDYTMAATPYVVSLCGAEIIPVDISRRDFGIDWMAAQYRLYEAAAIMPVPINGRPCADEMPYCNAIHLMCGDRITVIEDACQALGSWCAGKHLGTIGDIGVVSFNTFKIISTGQGGALLTDNEELHKKIRKIKDFGRVGGRGTVYETLGMNAKFTDLQAVIGIEQMKRLPERVNKKKAIWLQYHDRLVDLERENFIWIPDTNLEECAPWYMDLLVKDRDKLIDYLMCKGIETQPFYPPVHRLPYYIKKWGKEKFPNADYVSEHGIWLPSSFKLSEGQVDRVCEEIRRFYKG